MDPYGIQIVGHGDKPIMIDHRGILQTWVDTVIENLDENNPITILFYIPDNVSYVRQLRLNLRFEAFRAYDKATDNMETIVTTEEPEDNHTHMVELQVTGEATGIAHGSSSYTTYTEVASDEQGDHNHQYTIEHKIADDYRHVHTDLDYAYTHESTGSHYHNSDGHSHPMKQGIWEDEESTPSDVVVYINGEEVEEEFEETVEDINLPVEFVGIGWNTIEITSKSLGRISASYFLQAFTTTGV